MDEFTACEQAYKNGYEQGLMDLPQFGEIIYQKQMEKMENDIYQEIVKVGITVDKDKIAKALTNAREFYKEGYEQGQRDAVKHGRCKFCGGKDNAFHIINAETAAYSGIELAINRQGMLRVRVYDDYESETALPRSSEIIMIANCPNCGCKMDLEEST